MKSIIYRGGVVQFRIPLHWKEEYSDFDGGTFYDWHPDSGTLRLTVTTISTPKQLQADSAKDILEVITTGLSKRGVQGHVKVRKDGNPVFKYEESTREKGIGLQIVYWVIAQSLPPHDARVVSFSYTILTSQRNKPSIQSELEEIEQEIDLATFAPKICITST